MLYVTVENATITGPGYLDSYITSHPDNHTVAVATESSFDHPQNRENGHKPHNRMILVAEPQTGKTGVYLGVSNDLMLLKMRTY